MTAETTRRSTSNLEYDTHDQLASGLWFQPFLLDLQKVVQFLHKPCGYEAWTLDSEGDHLRVGRNGCS